MLIGGDFDALSREEIAKSISSLPAHLEYCTPELTNAQQERLALCWGLSTYQFSVYRENHTTTPILHAKEAIRTVYPFVQAVHWVRDCINETPEQLSPSTFMQKTKAYLDPLGAEVKVIEGATLENDYPLVHAVGRSSRHEPLVLDITWGERNGKKLTLVGKGVCFDSGGYNLKPGNSMLNMKKDMGGAAHVASLGALIMQAALPTRLRILIPLVENLISESAYKPGDVLRARNGNTIEITNTDAEGRLILADALTAATEESPELIIDMATLTGAARVALGAEVPAYFTADDQLATALEQAATHQEETLWRLPLYQNYQNKLKSHIADFTNASKDGEAGAITAALFLQKFVNHLPWIHVDVMAWCANGSALCPVPGGEAQGLMGLYEFVKRWIKQG